MAKLSPNLTLINRVTARVREQNQKSVEPLRIPPVTATVLPDQQEQGWKNRRRRRRRDSVIINYFSVSIWTRSEWKTAIRGGTELLLIRFLWLYLLPVLPPGVAPDTLPLGGAVWASITVVQLHPAQSPTMGAKVTEEHTLACANVAAVGAL